eukprot:CCRYP_011329-RA/>CCRYP_011329-RA protein AED:0.36 eAED:0.39 QI:0/0/0/1/0/0/3/0/333
MNSRTRTTCGTKFTMGTSIWKSDEGILANKLLKKRLAEEGYIELPHTPGLFKHLNRPIQFALVVDNFGIKYHCKQHLEHLINTIRCHYEVTLDETGSLYCGITLDWHYDQGYIYISMSGYVKNNSSNPKKPVNTPWEPCAIHYGAKTQCTLPVDNSPRLDKHGIRRIQQIAGSFLYYCCATDPTILHALSELSTQQSNATKNMLARCNHFLDYMWTHPNALIRYYASNMILKVHSDASYLSAKDAKSRAAGIFFLSSLPRDNHPILLNGAIAVLCTTLKFVAASAAEAELGAFFSTQKKQNSCALPWKNSCTPSLPHPSMSTIRQQLVLSIIR